MSNADKTKSGLSFESLMSYYEQQFAGICVDQEIDPGSYEQQEAKIATELASDLVTKLNNLKLGRKREEKYEEKKSFDTSKYGEEYDEEKAYESFDSDKFVAMDEDLFKEETKKMRRKAKKLRQETKRIAKLAKKQEKARTKIRETGRGLEPGHAVVSCPDCAARLLIGINWLEHRI